MPRLRSHLLVPILSLIALAFFFPALAKSLYQNLPSGLCPEDAASGSTRLLGAFGRAGGPRKATAGGFDRTSKAPVSGGNRPLGRRTPRGQPRQPRAALKPPRGPLGKARFSHRATPQARDSGPAPSLTPSPLGLYKSRDTEFLLDSRQPLT
jgi:hypothetical protein